jgi:hypothetical protein
MMAVRSHGQELDPFCARELLESVGAKLGATIHIEVKRPKSRGRYTMNETTKRRLSGYSAGAKKIPVLLRATRRVQPERLALV